MFHVKQKGKFMKLLIFFIITIFSFANKKHGYINEY